jgi:hypothetical protein
MTAETVTTVPTVRMSRIMPAPREEVFAAWLDADGMRASTLRSTRVSAASSISSCTAWKTPTR